MVTPRVSRWGLIFGAVVVLVLLAIGGVAPAVPTAAQGQWVGLVIQFPNSTHQECIAYQSNSNMSGYDVLRASAYSQTLQADFNFGSFGAGICKISDTGCTVGEGCFCQCKPGDCKYWAYHQLVNGAWQYSSIGASTRRPQPGDVEGWAWGVGDSTTGAKPPVLSFAQVCAAQLATATPTASATPTLTASPTTATATPSATTATPTASATLGPGTPSPTTGTATTTAGAPTQPPLSERNENPFEEPAASPTPPARPVAPTNDPSKPTSTPVPSATPEPSATPQPSATPEPSATLQPTNVPPTAEVPTVASEPPTAALPTFALTPTLFVPPTALALPTLPVSPTVDSGYPAPTIPTTPITPTAQVAVSTPPAAVAEPTGPASAFAPTPEQAAMATSDPAFDEEPTPATSSDAPEVPPEVPEEAASSALGNPLTYLAFALIAGGLGTLGYNAWRRRQRAQQSDVEIEDLE